MNTWRETFTFDTTGTYFVTLTSDGDSSIYATGWWGSEQAGAIARFSANDGSLVWANRYYLSDTTPLVFYTSNIYPNGDILAVGAYDYNNTATSGSIAVAVLQNTGVVTSAYIVNTDVFTQAFTSMITSDQGKTHIFLN